MKKRHRQTPRGAQAPRGDQGAWADAVCRLHGECLYDPEFGYYRSESRALPIFIPASMCIPSSAGCCPASLLKCGICWQTRGVHGGRSRRGHWAPGRAYSRFCGARVGDFYSIAVPGRRAIGRAPRGAANRSVRPTLARDMRLFRWRTCHSIPVGCILSNELLDALPVHRVVMLPSCARCT